MELERMDGMDGPYPSIVFGPIDFANLRNPFERDQNYNGRIWLHTNSIFKLLKLREEQRFFKFAFWVRNILPRGLMGLLTKMAKQIFGRFFGHLSHFFLNWILWVGSSEERMGNQ